MSDLSALTVVIPTIDGHKYLFETLRFWEETNAELLVLDASDKVFDSNGPGSMTYLHMPGSSYNERMARAVSLVKTDYVVMACDDELYVPTALASCIKLLEVDDSVVSAIGASVAVRLKDGSAYWGQQYGFLQNMPEQSDFDEKRVREHFANYGPKYYYAVTRTHYWKTIWSHISKKVFRPFAINELQYELGLSLFGKVASVPELMWIRNQMETSRGDPSRPRVWNWWYLPENKIEVKNLVNSLSILAIEISKVKGKQNFVDPQLFVRTVFMGYFRGRKKRTIMSGAQKIFNTLAGSMPTPLKTRVKNILGIPRVPKSLSECLSKGISADQKQLDEMRSALLKVRKVETCLN